MTGNSEGHESLQRKNLMNDTDNQQKRNADKDLGWLVGVLEGEGCFTIQQRKNKHSTSYTPLVQITNTNPDMILKAKRILTELKIPCYIYLQKQGDYRLCYRVVTLGIKRVKRLLDILEPHIECRSEQARSLQKFVNSRLSRPRGAELTYNEFCSMDKLARLNRPHLFSETARSQRIPAKIQSELPGNGKAAKNHHKQRLFEVEEVA